MTTTEENMTMVEDCEKRESRLTDWQRTFIDSVKKQLEDGRPLTKRQKETLDDVWEEATANG